MRHFRIDPPFIVQMSGGRTSAFMLWKIIQAHGGKLPDGAVVCFENTGRERQETLDFVHEIEKRWGVPIVWLEYCTREETSDGVTVLSHDFKVVDYETAARNGEPFAAVIQKKRFLPNPVTRFCTSELKVKTAQRYLVSLGWDHWDSVVGIRYDEPRRWSRMLNKPAGGAFRKDRASYAAMKNTAVRQGLLFSDEPSISCFCGD